MVGKILLRAAAGFLLALHVAVSPALADNAEGAEFRSPAAAVDALLEALRVDDMEGLVAIFGADSKGLLYSGDEVADQETRRKFVEHADLRTVLDRESDGRVVMSIGEDEWPFPIPLIKGDTGWYFDTAGGREELINRRIGRNELYAMAVVDAFVNAQNEYYARAPMGDAPRQFAQRISSSEGKRDGLYWPAAEGDQESPLGPLVAKAAEEGYFDKENAPQDRPEPYHGYVFRILTAQGPSAPGGEGSYVQEGAMTLGFAVLAYPVEYGNSGVMTFMVNQRGIVYQKDLGEDTGKIAEAVMAFDPDDSWDPVPL